MCDLGSGLKLRLGGTHDTCFCELISAGGMASSAGDEPIREELRPAKGFSRLRAEVAARGMALSSFRVRSS